jgi:diacylglycerol kinase
METTKFSWKQRARSFRFAWQGIVQFFGTQHNALLHALVTVLVVVLGFWKHISVTEWLFIVTMIGLVWMAELFNTAIEGLCNMVHPGRHPQIKFIKDVAAAAVLVSAIAALATGCIIFIPKFI